MVDSFIDLRDDLEVSQLEGRNMIKSGRAFKLLDRHESIQGLQQASCFHISYADYSMYSTFLVSNRLARIGSV